MLLRLRAAAVVAAVVVAGCAPDWFGVGDASGTGPAGTSGSTTTGASTESLGPTTASAGSGGAGSSGSVDTGSSSVGSGPTGTSSGQTGGSSTGGAPFMLCAADPDLAACYDFAGVGGGMLWDLSGNGNDAPAVGVGVVPGPFGEAATFDAASELAVPDSPSLDISGPITLEAWVRVDALPGAGRFGVLDNELQYAITIHASNEYRCALASANFLVGPVVVGSWSHVACVYDEATVRLYVDGAQVGMTDASGPLGTDNGDPMSVGDTSPGFTEPFIGAIGGLRVWSTARTAPQICEAAGERCGA